MLLHPVFLIGSLVAYHMMWEPYLCLIAPKR